jgi:hypothetical protein
LLTLRLTHRERFDMVAVKSVNSANIKKSMELVDCEEAVINLQFHRSLPLAKIALEAHALGYPEGRDDASLDLLASLWPGRLVAKVSFSRAARGPLVIIFNLPRLICTSDRVTFI